jgi:UDP-2,3-diacylglucosamine pyrophosphatase LpxH
MLKTKDLIVISDIHLAAERDRGLFRADTDLANFLKWILDETQDSVLVLNGDIFDFLVNENGSETVSLGDAREKIEKIIENHPEVFDSLANLANSPRHQLFILSGNHDPEVALPIVQSTIENSLRRENFTPNVRWVTIGNALLIQVGESRILIEHGDLFDDWNRIDNKELHSSIVHNTRNLEFDGYKPPTGSYLVGHLTPLRKKYPWIDSFKPLSVNTFPLIWAFAKQELSDPRQLRVFGDVLHDGIRVGSTWLFRQIKEFIGKGTLLADEDSAAYAAWRDSEINEPKTLSDKDIIELTRRLKKVSAQDTTFDVEAPEINSFKMRYLKAYSNKKNLSAVIHGHTHSAKNYAIENGELLYLNSGTWGRLLQLPKEQDSDNVWKAFLADLEAGVDDSFNRLTFVRITQDTKIKASLNEWKQGRIEELAVSYLDPTSKTWKKDE